MATSVGAAAAQGLETGFGLALRYNEQEESKRARGAQEARQTQQDALAASRDARDEKRLAIAEDENKQRNARLDAIETRKAHAAQLDALNKAVDSLDREAANFNGNKEPLPAGWLENATRVKRARDAYIAENFLQPAKNDASFLASGKTSIDAMPADKFAQSVMATTHSTPQQLELYSQGVDEVTSGVQTKNQALIVSGGNKILRRDLNQGVGDFTPSGHRITYKELIALDPARDAQGRDIPGMVIPRIRVYVDNGDDNNDEGVGAWYYDAPLTEDRSTDPNAKVKAVSIDKLFDGLGNVGMLGTALKNPAIKAKFDEGVKQSSDWIAQTFGVSGASKRKTYSIEAKAREYAKIDEQVETGEITPEEGRARKLDLQGRTMTPLQEAKTEGVKVATGLAPALAKAKADTAAAALIRAQAVKGKVANSGFKGLPGDAPAGDNEKKVIDFYALRSLGGDDDWRKNLRGKEGAALASSVARRVPAMAEEMGLQPGDIGTTAAKRKALDKTLVELTKRSEAVELFSSKVDKDMRTLESLINSGTAGMVPLLNKPLNALRKAGGSPELSEFLLAAKQVGVEYERLINGGTLSVAQLHEGAREDAKEIINENMTAAQIRRILPLMRQEMKNAKDAAHESRAAITRQLTELTPGGTGVKAAVAASGAPAPAPAAAPAGGEKTATNPKTGEKLVLRNGQWVPLK